MKTIFRSILAVALIFNTSVALAQTLVKLETSLGAITLELDAEKAPLTVENFLNYLNDDFYNGLIFHRVIPGFMIQGGGMDEEMTPRPNRKPVKNEAMNGLQNQRGTVAMARTRDPDSATAQFFINTVDNAFLNYSPNNPGYTVFGKVVEGMEVVDKIAEVETGNVGPFKNVPSTPIFIISATLLAQTDS